MRVAAESVQNPSGAGPIHQWAGMGRPIGSRASWLRVMVLGMLTAHAK